MGNSLRDRPSFGHNRGLRKLSEGEQRAQETIDVYWADFDVPSAPIDPVVIARKLGINVYEAPMTADISGYIIKKDAYSTPDIFVNSQHAPVRQRFTIAHELGHYFNQLDLDPENSAPYVYRRDRLATCGTDAQEIYANSFAAALLMPEDLVVDLHAQKLSPMEIASRLRVSLESLGIRMKNLRLS